MRNTFKITQLSRPKNMKVELIFEEEYFSPNLYALSIERFNALWGFIENDWADEKFAVVEHDGFDDKGYPKNPVFIEVSYENSFPFTKPSTH